MSISEIVGAIGEWTIKLRDDTPREIMDRLDYFGHIAYVSGRINPARYGDGILQTARYVGVLRGKTLSQSGKSIEGPGMAMWLADGDGKGDVIEGPVNFTNASFTTAVNAAIPSSLVAGSIFAQSGLYTSTHQYQSKRKMLDYITNLYNCEWRVNGAGTIDIGLPTQLYSPNPTCAIVARMPEGGVDMDRRALVGQSELSADMEDFTTRVFLVSEPQDGSPIVTGSANIAGGLNPYKDIRGGTLKMTRLVSGDNTVSANADSVAQLQLNRFTSPRESVTVTTVTHDIKGDLVAGGYVWVEDPESDLVDMANQVRFKNLVLNPVKLRVLSLSYPIEDGNTIAYRHWDGTWLDLTPYVQFEEGQTTVEVGGYLRSLTGSNSNIQAVGVIPLVNSTIPAAPSWITPFTQASYISKIDGSSRSQAVLQWTRPLNTDGTVVVDGGRYEVRYRSTAIDAFITAENSWNYLNLAWGVEKFLLLDLIPSTTYEMQIRAVDNGTPENVGNWSTLYSFVSIADMTPPPAPAPCSVAASTIAVQIQHTCGVATGGTYNLPNDLHHFNVYDGATAGFTPDNTCRIGTLLANTGNLIGSIPAVATFNVASTAARWYKVTAVDISGNESLPSTAVQSTATLVDSAHISDLIVSKVTAGTISATWVQGNTITTSATGTGQRVDNAYHGIEAFNSSNVKTFDLNSSDGSFFATGTIQTGLVGRRVVMSGAQNEVVFFPQVGETRWGRLFSYIPIDYPNDIAIELRSIDTDTHDYFGRATVFPDWVALQVTPWADSLQAKAQVGVKKDYVWMSTNRLAGSHTSPTLGIVEVGEYWAGMRIFDSSSSLKDYFYMDQYSIDLEVRNGIAKDGGYLQLGKNGYFDTVLGSFVTGSINSGIEFNGDDIWLYRDGTTRWINLTNGTRFNDTMFCLYAAGYSNDQLRFMCEGGQKIFASRSAVPGSLTFHDNGGGPPIKTFVIDHPVDEDRKLVHATTESPHAGTEYWGTVVVEDGFARVQLPAYFEALNSTDGRAVLLTVIAEARAADREALPRSTDLPEPVEPEVKELVVPVGKSYEIVVQKGGSGYPAGQHMSVMATYPTDGAFEIYADGPDKTFRVSWLVKAVRKDVPQFNVEPLKTEGTLRGDGPYTYLV